MQPLAFTVEFSSGLLLCNSKAQMFALFKCHFQVSSVADVTVNVVDEPFSDAHDEVPVTLWVSRV